MARIKMSEETKEQIINRLGNKLKEYMSEDKFDEFLTEITFEAFLLDVVNMPDGDEKRTILANIKKNMGEVKA